MLASDHPYARAKRCTSPVRRAAYPSTSLSRNAAGSKYDCHSCPQAAQFRLSETSACGSNSDIRSTTRSRKRAGSADPPTSSSALTADIQRSARTSAASAPSPFGVHAARSVLSGSRKRTAHSPSVNRNSDASTVRGGTSSCVASSASCSRALHVGHAVSHSSRAPNVPMRMASNSRSRSPTLKCASVSNGIPHALSSSTSSRHGRSTVAARSHVSSKRESSSAMACMLMSCMLVALHAIRTALPAR